MTVIGDALSGFAKSVVAGHITTKKASSHQIYIETKLLPHTVKLQKEAGWRRYKEAQTPLQEAVMALKDFAKEEWPITAKATTKSKTSNANHVEKSSNIATTTTATTPISIESSSSPKTSQEQDEKSKEQTNHSDVTKQQQEEEPDKHTNDDFKQHAAASTLLAEDTNGTSTMQSKSGDDLIEDETNTTTNGNNQQSASTTVVVVENVASLSSGQHSNNHHPAAEQPPIVVHSAIRQTIEAYLAVLAHPAKASRPTELALEGLTMIVDHQYYTGRAGGVDDTATTAPPPGSSSLLHRVLQGISDISESNSESVQSAVIKTLTTIVTSPTCYVHEGSLLLAMRATFRVYLVAKSATCKDNARTALLNMLRAVFIRMEAHEAIVRDVDAVVEVEVSSLSSSSPPRSRSQSTESPMNGGGIVHLNENNDGNNTVVSSSTATTTDETDGRTTTSTNGGSLASSASSPALLGSLQHPTTPTAKGKQNFKSQYHADAYFLFRALCKLSSKELPADNLDESERKGMLFNTNATYTDPTELNGKILSLELILAAIDVCGDAFTTNDKFLYLVQHYLSGSLLKNCVSNHTQVAFLSQRIFLVLVYKFKDQLKQDIEVFMSNVFFRVLESQNSTFKQKALVLESLRTICKDPVILTQIFLNYDCDFNAMSLYKDILQMLTKLSGKATTSSAPSMSNLSKKDAEREFDLSLAALECLVNILKTFLRALTLPGGEDNDDSDDIAGMRIRSMLNLGQALAAAGVPGNYHTTNQNHSSAMSTADSSVDEASMHSVRSNSAPAAAGSASGPLASEPSSTSAPSDVAGQIVDAFDRKRNAEQNFEIGSVKFTLSLKSGLSYFIEHGFLSLDAREVAVFFIANKDKLDKTQMGEALGREPYAGFVKGDNVEADKGGPGFWFRILHYYAESLDLADLCFDEAIRLFLSGFRLPGEAQKIDRIMEKFAERFTAQNPEIFPSSDTAFILAFSVIMLNTDLHNPSIKPERRMTVESFLRNNRGIGENGGDLPDDFLRGIFDRIKESPFSLKEDDAARERVGASKQIFDTSIFFEGPAGLFGASAEERRRENFMKERDEMMAVTERLIKRRDKNNGKNQSSSKGPSLANSVAPAEVVKPMFDITWGPVLGILSQVLECSDDERSVAVCLNGFVFAVRLAANSGMSLVRDTFMSSLAKFTFLGSIKEMKRKNVESIRTLLSIAVADGEYLGESWGPVLQCISQLARLRLSASGLDSDESFLVVDDPKKIAKRDASKQGLFSQPSREELAREAEGNNAKAVLEAVQEVLIDKVFSSTNSLSAKSLAHFIQQMIAVSSSEINGHSKSGITGVEAVKKNSDNSDGPSIFMLQRLVDVADHNMNVRPRLVWTQVWDLMADFFAKNACHSNSMVSVFAIDSLKQLSMKFLDKPELSEFNFQSSFLKPFQVVIENKFSRDDAREMVLNCVDNIIRSKSQNLRSGWKVLFSILTISAGDANEKIETIGLTILQRLLDEHLDDVGSLVDKHAAHVELEEMSSVDKRNRNANTDDFICLCKASISFLRADNSGYIRPIGLTLRAFCHIAIYADLIASNRVLPPVSGAQYLDSQLPGYTYDGLSEKESLDMVLWRPLFEGLAEGLKSTIATSESGVGCFIQRASILALRAIFLRHGHTFSSLQFAAILSETIIPAMQEAAEKDQSPVVSITSESPLISNIDFLVDSMPLPPAPDDPELLQFEVQNNRLERALGPSELMLEASFTDLRHGGDGDLRKAHKLAKKSPSDSLKATEQPFPDSWLATTASMALGLLTDITTEYVISRGPEGRERIWPIISEQYRLWYAGRVQKEENVSQSDGSNISSWAPCEALVRISCREILRLSNRFAMDYDVSSLPEQEKTTWSSLLLNFVSDLLAESLEQEEYLRVELLRLKMGNTHRKHEEKTEVSAASKQKAADESVVHTPFGKGKVVNRRRHEFHDEDFEYSSKVIMDVIALDFGATLYRPASVSIGEKILEEKSNGSAFSEDDDLYWIKLVPALKIRCIAAHCLQQVLVDGCELFVSLATKDIMSTLLHNLQTSSLTSSSAVRDENISAAFQLVLLEEWGDGNLVPDDRTESSARFSLLHGSAVYFLSQEASAIKASISVLSMLYLNGEVEMAKKASVVNWNRANFAESHLVRTIQDVLEKFLESERKEGHLVDLNMWRNTNEIGAKVALYCTALAPIVVEALKILRSMSSDRFEKYKHIFFPLLCALIQVQSEEIRELVQQTFTVLVGPMIGVRAVP